MWHAIRLDEHKPVNMATWEIARQMFARNEHVERA
jgi:hypothetical protein